MQKAKYFLISLLMLLVACSPARAYKVPYSDLTNLVGATWTHARGAGESRKTAVGKNKNCPTFQKTQPASNSFPPYIIECRQKGERIPRVHISFTAPAQNQNQQYKEGNKKKRPTQGGVKQKKYWRDKEADGMTDHYDPGPCPNCHEDPYLPKAPVVQEPDPETEANADEQARENPEASGPATAQNTFPQKPKKRFQQADQASSPHPNFEKGKNSMRGQGQGAGESFADAFNPAWEAMLQLHSSYLINVANESSGQPCSARTPVKVHENAVWMVMQMYKRVYLQIALLLVLPGAVLTQLKGLVSGGILQSQNDEDAVSPFAGIQKGVIAVFLIPATQLIVSYSIDVGNSMSFEVKERIGDNGMQMLYEWADEQVFRAPESKKKESIKNPNMFAVLGKLSEGSEKESGVEPQSEATVMLQTLVNLSAMSGAFTLVMLCAFQITLISYMLLLGPIAAAFYAWPASVSTLFARVFSSWVDAVVNVSLWRFWWTTVLLTALTRIEWLQEIGQYNPYCEWEMIIFVSFIVILSYVPFNPFDFKAGEMVSQIMQKSEMAVNEATQKGGK